MVPAVPFLAPLFDKMTTHVKSQRFKAVDALAFFEASAQQLASHVLEQQIELNPDWATVEDSTLYWSKLPPHFSTTWAVYRTPPPSRVDRLLDFVASYAIGWKTLRALRRILYL